MRLRIADGFGAAGAPRALVADGLEHVELRRAARRPDRRDHPQQCGDDEHRHQLTDRDRQRVDPEVLQRLLHRPPEQDPDREA
jgi:hypothetical protein